MILAGAGSSLLPTSQVWLSVRVKVSPKQLEVGSVLLLNLYLEIHFFYVASDTDRISTETDKDVEKILL